MKIIKIGSLPEFKFNAGLSFFKGSQTPTPLITKDGLKLSFSARSMTSKSYCFSYLLDLDNPLKVLQEPIKTDFSPSQELGYFYSDGFMISQYKDDIIYFTGWETVDMPVVKYRLSCGKAYPLEKSYVVDKAPFLDRCSKAPCGSSMPFIYGSECYFMGIEEWHLAESFYSIFSYSKSSNNYSIFEKIIPRLGDEGGLARPVVFEKDKEKYMMFSARGKFKFRSERTESYKLWLAKYDGEKWNREGQLDIENSEEDFMQAYGYPIQIKDKWYLFYNNQFTSAIQVAEIK